jgi:Uma2 family endonuclease
MVVMSAEFDLPIDGTITRADFAGLPEPPRGWAWELRSGRLGLNHMPVVGWHWLVVLAALEYWKSLGHVVLGEQYVADSGFVRGGTGKHNFVADGVVFKVGYDPDLDLATHDAADLHAVIEAVSKDSEERDAKEKYAAYATLGVPHYWIVRRRPEARKDGVISMYELVDGAYKLTGTRLVSELADSGYGAQ